MAFVALIGAVCFFAGLIGPAVVSWFTPYPGADVRCIEGERICVGMAADLVLSSFEVEEPLGGMIDLTCDYAEPGQGAANRIGVAGLIRRKCTAPKMVATFTKGDDLTNLWIEDGLIVRIDRYPRHSLDF